MRTYMTEAAVTVVTAILLSSAAFAGPFGLPDHQQNGYRDTGCDPDFQVQIKNDEGEHLYSNNPTCPAVGGPSDADREAAKLKAAEEEEEEEEEEEPKA